MSKPAEIDTLLNAKRSPSVARQLVKWADDARSRIARGDRMVGILTPDEVQKIPLAYRAAAEQGETDAWIPLAWWHANPPWGKPDLQAAEQSLQAALDAKVSGAPLEVVKIRWFYKRETATPTEKKQAYRLVSDLVEAEPSNAAGVYFLALLTTHGFGKAASVKKGFLLQQRAAELGSADALFELYIHYATGSGVSKDEPAALEACRRAAEAGHARAMYNIGAYNASGRGMPKNIPEALKWYERAADAGNPSAMVGLAVIHATGDGVKKDKKVAKQWFAQADSCGLDVSQARKQVGC